MSSSPVMPPSISIGAGSVLTGGAGTPDLTGLGGLFGSLMNGASAVQSFGAGMNGITLGAAQGVDAASFAAFDVEAFFAAQGVVEQTLQLDADAPAITVKGDAETVKAFMEQVKEIYQKIILERGLTLGESGDTAALAGALQELGMEPEAAQGVAARIDTMMQLIEQYHSKEKELDAETAGTLAAMMLAVMGQSVQATEGGDDQAFSLQITTVEQTLTVSSRPLSSIFSQDSASAILRTTEGDKPVKPLELPSTRMFEVSVAQDGETARVGMLLPETVGDEAGTPVASVPVAEPIMDAKDVTLAARAPLTGQAVARDEVVTIPEGETYYKLAADENGTETVEAVKPLPMAKDDVVERPADAVAAKADAATTQGQWMQQQRADALANPAMSAQAAASGTGYAEQYETIQGMLDKAQVAKQVAVQVQPLLENGGGTIRMSLNPHELGKVTVELTIADGKVHGAIAASEPRVVEQLARELHTLRQGLADAGLKVGEQGINLMLSNDNSQGQFGQQGQNPTQQSQKGRRANREGGVADAAGVMAPTAELATNLSAWVSPDRVLDLNV